MVPPGRTPRLLDANNQIRDLSGHLADVDGPALAPEQLAPLSKLDLATLLVVDGSPRLGCPVGSVSKFIAVGLNYADHAAKSGVALPEEPIIFLKATTCIIGPNDDIVIPRIRRRPTGRLNSASSSAGWPDTSRRSVGLCRWLCLVNDVSEREFQLERGGTWDKGKGCDTFGPIGPFLVTRDEVPDPQSLAMWLDVNGERMQRGNTNDGFGVRLRELR